MSELSKELVFLILQFLDEENYKETVHRLESESGLFCNVKYVGELVTNGDWEELEKYLNGFLHLDDNRYSVKMLFDIRKQKYLEALDRKDHAKAVEILNKDLKVFKTFNEELFKELALLLTTGDIRENEQLSTYTDAKTARSVLLEELKKLIETNPKFHDKCHFPVVRSSRLRLLINQSLNWQHELCRNPKPNPDIKTILRDHTCGPSNTAQAQAPMPNSFGSMLRAGGFHPMLQPSEAQVLTVNQPTLTHYPTTAGVLTHVVHNLPTSSIARVHQSSFYGIVPSDDLPKNVISVINQGSEVKTMDFHPEHQSLLLVGTNTGDIAIWDVGSRVQIAHRSFNVWNIRACSTPLQASLVNEQSVSVNRVTWSPDGLLFGVAYSKHIVHVYSYYAGPELRDHLEIEAHVGNVNDLAFTIRGHKLLIITCGEDKTIKVWDAVTGANRHTFEGHDAPVYSVCPHRKAGIQFIFSTAIDGKIKAWLYDEPGSKLDFDAPGHNCTRMTYSTDGSRLFSCGSSKDQESYLVEWNESEGTLKQKYIGLGKQHDGVVQFDTNKRFLAAGDEFCIKFWDMNNKHLLFTTNADGGLLVNPCVRFNKSGILLAVSTCENGVKILGNAEGRQIVKNMENQSGGGLGTVAMITACAGSSSVAGTSIGIPDRSIPFPVTAALNQDIPSLPKRRSRNTDELQNSIVWKPKEISEPSQLRSMRIPDNLLPVRIIRLMYAFSGSGVLALGYNGVHKLWKWEKNDQNTTGNATADVAPQLWQPPSGILMTNDIRDDANMENIVPCVVISKNNSYVLSASGGKVSLFNMATFKCLTSFLHPQPAATCLVFHPRDNNIVAVGMSDSSIQIYNVRVDQVSEKLMGHQKCVTGLAFSIDKKILISSGADAQLCVWNTDTWEKQTSKFLKLPSRRRNNPQAETRVHFNPDQTRLLVVHETQVAIYDPVKLDCVLQWVPRQSSGSITDGVYSCDGKSVFVSIEDGSVNVLAANQLRLKCRINYAAYMPWPSNSSGIRVYPNAVAAHPSDPNQVSVGLSHGGVYVLEPLESDKEWGTDPYSAAENGAGPSTNRGSNHP